MLSRFFAVIRSDVRLLAALLGFISLSLPAFVLLGLAFVGILDVVRVSVIDQSVNDPMILVAGVLVSALLASALVGVVGGIGYEWHLRRLELAGPSMALREHGLNGGAILGGAVATIGIVIEFDASPIVAAGIVGIVAAVFVPVRAVPAYCGAFVGMTSPTLFVTYWHTVIAAGLAAIVYALATPVYRGVGGKLGTTAFVGAIVTVFVTVGESHAVPIPSPTTTALAVGHAVAAAAVTFAIHTRTRSDPVLASGAVGVLVGLLAAGPYGVRGPIIGAAAYAASFVGMSAPERLPDERWIAGAGLIAGLAVVYSGPYLGGSGGKLGTIAFGSSLAVHALVCWLGMGRARQLAADSTARDTT